MDAPLIGTSNFFSIYPLIKLDISCVIENPRMGICMKSSKVFWIPWQTGGGDIICENLHIIEGKKSYLVLGDS